MSKAVREFTDEFIFRVRIRPRYDEVVLLDNPRAKAFKARLSIHGEVTAFGRSARFMKLS